MQKKHCWGVRNDFYNGKNDLGVKECWSFDSKKKEQGVNVFLLALHLHPKSANLYDSLAEAYYYNNDFKNAISNYNKSLELNPENQNAIDRLKQINQWSQQVTKYIKYRRNTG